MVELVSFMSCIFYHNKKVKYGGKEYLYLKDEQNWQTFTQAHQEYERTSYLYLDWKKGDIITDTSDIKNDSETSTNCSVPIHLTT